MFSFDGKYRTTPMVSLGGRSKNSKLSTKALLDKAHSERQRREQIRLRNHSALVIQSFYRSFRVRSAVKNKLREQFDQHQCSKTQYTLFDLTRWLVIFYDSKSSQDNVRYLWLGKLLIQSKNNKEILEHDYNCMYITSLLFSISCKSLLSSPSAYQVPLRLFEVILNEGNLMKTRGISTSNCKAVLSHLWANLVTADYFKGIISCLQKNAPGDIPTASIDCTDVKSPTYLAENLMHLVVKPILYIQNIDDSSFHSQKKLIIAKFCSQVLSLPLSQIFYFILPCVARNADFKVNKFLEVLLQNLNESSKSKSKINASVPLFAGLIRIVYPGLENLSSEVFIAFVKCVEMLVTELPSEYQSVEDDLESDDEMESIAISNTSQDVHFRSADELAISDLIEDCHTLINSQKFVDCCIKHEIHRTDNINAVCNISYHLIVVMRIRVHKNKLLYTLAFSSKFIQDLWKCIIGQTAKSRVTGSQVPVLQTFLSSSKVMPQTTSMMLKQLITFCSLYLHNLLSLNDVDFYNTSSDNKYMSISLDNLITVALILRDISLSLIKQVLPESTNKARMYNLRDGVNALSSGSFLPFNKQNLENTFNVNDAVFLFILCSRLVKHIHSRNVRQEFMDITMWFSNSIRIMHDQSNSIANRWQPPNVHNAVAEHLANMSDENSHLSTSEAQQIAVLTSIPFVVPFNTRVKIFKTMVKKDNQAFNSPTAFIEDPADFNPDAQNRQTKIDITVRRQYLYEDSFNDLSPQNVPEMRLPMRVKFISVAGAEEAGYGQGVTREFLQQIVKHGFYPNRGFFKLTENGRLYPNPNAKLIAPTYRDHFYFLGRMLGKLIYEGMQVELPFAPFFLCKILRVRNSDIDINHLKSLDPEYYKNLMDLHNFKGDISDLDLTFTVVVERFGETREVELVPNGKNIPVTNSNKIMYMHSVANYKLNVEMRDACLSFQSGLQSVVPLEWLQMFDYAEFQTLISGAEVPIDVEDLKQHTVYSGGYNASHPIIVAFWEIVQSFTDDQLRNLLQFVTSCSRPPFGGFKELFPPFCIHNGGREDRLPSASTCVNMMKLPEFNDNVMLRERILQSICSSEGFELS